MPNLSEFVDLTDATITIHIPCTTCKGKGVVEMGAENTMPTRTLCPTCAGAQRVNMEFGLRVFAKLLAQS